jgi:hypothetical protein
MDTNEMILDELRRIRKVLEGNAPKRWQKIPEASVTLGVPQSALRRLADNNKIPVMVTSRTKVRKAYQIDVIRTRMFLEEGGLMPKVK